MHGNCETSLLFSFTGVWVVFDPRDHVQEVFILVLSKI